MAKAKEAVDKANCMLMERSRGQQWVAGREAREEDGWASKQARGQCWELPIVVREKDCHTDHRLLLGILLSYASLSSTTPNIDE